MGTMTFSTVVGQEEPLPGVRGRRAYDREHIYRWLYENSDHRGIVVYTQRAIATKLEISYQTLSEIFTDFCETGHLKKHGLQFEVVYDPDDLDWGEKFKKAQVIVRSKYY